MFLYERFPDYGPARRIAKLLVGDNSPPEYRVRGWSLGHPLQPLVNLIDDEGSFVFRPYTSSFFLGLRGVDRIYLEPPFSTRNNKGSRIEGVFDFWLLCVRPHVLLGFIVTDTVGIIGGALFPFSYRPDRVCRQFGFDQPPLPLELGLLPVHEAMKVVLFEERNCLPSFDSSLFVPPDRVGHVLDEWVIYQHRLKASVVFYEGVKSASPPHKILIMYKDPYYVTSIATDQDKSDASSKKRKSASSQKGKAKVLASAHPVKKVPMRIPSVMKRPLFQVATPRRASARLKARPAQDSTQNTPPVNPDIERATGSGSLREMKHASGQAQAVICNFSVEAVNLPSHVVTPIASSNSLSLLGHTPLGEWFDESV
ncbi:CHD3-type chromatin-remodeling factor PICKLE [Sesbania bispinosa]|nr:CHD3-type chromatin-remodeling factor PICKLE [Sesbania bispinosa]